MGLFSKLFGKNGAPEQKPLDLELTAELMDEDGVWPLVELSLEESGGDRMKSLDCSLRSSRWSSRRGFAVLIFGPAR